jgi:hypothetical protein
MKRSLQCARAGRRHPGSFYKRALATLLAVAAFSILALAQDDNSLGDLARQTRQQKKAVEADSTSGKAQALVDEMQQEEEEADSAPVGFKNYNAGDYRVYVPFPFSLEGRENGGAVLLGSRLGVTNTEVLAGTPIQIPPGASESDLLNVVRQYAGVYGTQAYCAAIKQGSHKAFRCAWQGNPYLLGHVVWGSMEFIVASNSLIPVMCVSPDDMHSCTIYDTYGHNTCSDRNAQKTREAIAASYREERTTFQLCDQVIYPSIRLKEEIVVHPATIGEKTIGEKTIGEKGPRAAVRLASDAAVQESAATSGAQISSLAELSRQTRQATHAKSQVELSDNEGGTLAPAGYQNISLHYCQNPQQCSEASVSIPQKAETVSQVNGQYIFKAELDGASMMLYAGPADVNAPYRSMTDPDYIRMRDLANSNGWSREKADAVSTQELTIDGNPALITRFRYHRDPSHWWIAERMLRQNQNQAQQFMLACTAPEEHFADAEVVCTTLVNSLRLQ